MPRGMLDLEERDRRNYVPEGAEDDPESDYYYMIRDPNSAYYREDLFGPRPRQPSLQPMPRGSGIGAMPTGGAIPSPNVMTDEEIMDIQRKRNPPSKPGITGDMLSPNVERFNPRAETIRPGRRPQSIMAPEDSRMKYLRSLGQTKGSVENIDPTVRQSVLQSVMQLPEGTGTSFPIGNGTRMYEKDAPRRFQPGYSLKKKKSRDERSGILANVLGV